MVILHILVAHGFITVRPLVGFSFVSFFYFSFQVFLYESDIMVAGAFSQLGPDASDLHAVGEADPKEGVFLLAKNSPYARMLSRGVARLRQTGTLDIIRGKWIKEAKAKSQSRYEEEHNAF